MLRVVYFDQRLNADRNSYFSIFCAKELKKKKKKIFSKILQKLVFLSLHQNADQLF